MRDGRKSGKRYTLDNSKKHRKEDKRMKYEEVVEIVREAYENVDARDVYEHVAIQVNVTGEGEGAFYIEIAGRAVSVEPYEYYDRDGLVTASADTIIAVAKGELPVEKAIEQGALQAEGNLDKIRVLTALKPVTTGKKKVAKKEGKA